MARTSRSRLLLITLTTGLFVDCAACADILFGIDGGGNLIEISTADGSAVLVGNSGHNANAMASDSENRIFTAGGSGADADLLILVDPVDGSGSVFLDLNRPPGFSVRGMAFDSNDNLFVALSMSGTTDIDLLATIDTETGEFSVVGATGVTDIQGLAFDANNILFFIGDNPNPGPIMQAHGIASLFERLERFGIEGNIHIHPLLFNTQR